MGLAFLEFPFDLRQAAVLQLRRLRIVAGTLGLLDLQAQRLQLLLQLARLRDWGCVVYQGFVRARPMATPQFRQFALSNA